MSNDEKILEILNQLQHGQANIHARLGVIEEKIDVIEEKIDVIEGDVNALKKDMAHHNHLVEPFFKAVKDGVEGLGERYEQIDRLENTVEQHDHRIFALEQVAAQKNL